MINLSQKRTCEGCKALEQYQGGTNKCTLGYSFDKNWKPIEPCPKPKTIMELFESRKLYSKNANA